MIPKTNLDFLFAQKDYSVYFDTEYQEWVWRKALSDGNGVVVHGANDGYTQADAYEDALRDMLGIIPIADEMARKL